jgi:hypothetical protein
MVILFMECQERGIIQLGDDGGIASGIETVSRVRKERTAAQVVMEVVGVRIRPLDRKSIV